MVLPFIDIHQEAIQPNFYQDVNSGVCYNVREEDNKLIIKASSDGLIKNRFFPKHFNGLLKPIYAQGKIEQMRQNASWLEEQISKGKD